MKTITRTIASVAAAAIALASSMPVANAADITLDGSGYYKLGNKIRHSHGWPKQTGRYKSLKGSYYHKSTISMEWITNNSNNRSGKLSFELWGMPYYGSTSGIVLMTRGFSGLPAGDFYKHKVCKGNAIFLDEYRFPELNIWEKTNNGWRFRDALAFSKKNLF